MSHGIYVAIALFTATAGTACTDLMPSDQARASGRARSMIVASAADMYARVAALPQTHREVAAAKLAAMPVEDYAQQVGELMTDDEIVIDDMVFVDSKSKYLDDMPGLLDVASRFASMGDLWNELGIDASAPSYDEFKGAIAGLASRDGPASVGWSLFEVQPNSNANCDQAHAFMKQEYAFSKEAMSQWLSAVADPDPSQRQPQRENSVVLPYERGTVVWHGYTSSGPSVDIERSNLGPGDRTNIRSYFSYCYTWQGAPKTHVQVAQPDGSTVLGNRLDFSLRGR